MYVAILTVGLKENIPNHGHTYGPWRVAYGQSEICIIGLLVLTFLHVMDNLSHASQHV
jgi:hypothetical protein